MPNHTVEPGQKGYGMIPITRNLPRSFVTNLKPGDSVPVGAPQLVRGIAFGGDRGVAAVDLSLDGGRTWQNHGPRQRRGHLRLPAMADHDSIPARGAHTVMARCTNTDRVMQPMRRVWNPGGYMSNQVETLDLVAAEEGAQPCLDPSAPPCWPASSPARRRPSPPRRLSFTRRPRSNPPFGDDVGFPTGPGSDVIASNCTACHSADHTLNQPALSREEWHTVVDKMITAYKAPISPEDARVIVDYLARVKGEP